MATTIARRCVYAAFASVLAIAGCDHNSDDGSPDDTEVLDPVVASECGGGRPGHPAFSFQVLNGAPQDAAPIGADVGALRIRLTCRDADDRLRDVQNATVAWTVTSGGGTVDGATTVTRTTDGSGESGVDWTFGMLVGNQSVEARFEPPSPPGSPPPAAVVLAFVGSAGPAPACDPTIAGTQHAAFDEERLISTSQTWTAAGSPHRGGVLRFRDGAVLTIEPGAKVCVQQLSFEAGGRLVAIGTPAERIVFASGAPGANTWAGLFFNPPPFGTSIGGRSVLRYVDVENPFLVQATAAHPLDVSDSTFTRTGSAPGCSSWWLTMTAVAGVGQTRVERVVVSGFGGTEAACPAVKVALDAQTPTGTNFTIGARVIGSVGTGVEVVNQSRVLEFVDCEISGSGGAGLRVHDGDPFVPTIRRCNITDNAGAGVWNEDAGTTLDARDNWWGSAAGADGPNGDGVAGLVDASNPRFTAVELGY